MTDIKDWKRVEAENDDAPPDGFPEGMDRPEVNDASREAMAATKRFYDDPEWRNPFAHFTLARSDDDTFTISDSGTATNAAQFLAVDQRIRITGASGTQYGFVTGVAYGAPVTTVDVELDSGVLPTAPLSAAEVSFRELERTAYSPLGATLGQSPPQVPTIDDLGDGATKAESALDVGQLGGSTRAEVLAEAHFRPAALVNPVMNIWQRDNLWDASASNYGVNDNGKVTADGWVLLSDGNDRFDVERSTDAPTGFRYALRLVGATLSASPSAQKGGIFQAIRHADSLPIHDPLSADPMVLSFWTKGSAAFTHVRAYVVSWSGVVNSPALPVSNWQSGVEDVDVTLVGNYAIEASERFAISPNWTRYAMAPFSISSATVNNVGILLHCDTNGHGNGDELLFTGVQLEHGLEASAFRSRGANEDLLACQQYFQKTQPQSFSVSHGAGVFDLDGALHAYSNSAGEVSFSWSLMAALAGGAPAVVAYNPGNATPAANEVVRNLDDSTDHLVSATYAGEHAVHVQATGVGSEKRCAVNLAVHDNLVGSE